MHDTGFIKTILMLFLIFPFSVGRAASCGNDLTAIGDQIEVAVKMKKSSELDRAKIIVEAQASLHQIMLAQATDDEAMIQFEGLKNVLEIIEVGLKKKKDCEGIRAQMVLEYGDRVEDLKDSSKFLLVGLKVLDLLCPGPGAKK